MSKRKLGRVALAIAWLLALGTARDARAVPPPPPDWELEIAPYAWLAMLHGSVDTPRGNEDFTVTAGDVIDSLDLGAFAAVKGRWRRFVFLTDFAWAKLSDDGGVGDFNVRYDLRQKLGWFQALGGYRVYERPGGLVGTPGPAEQRIFGVDLLAGLTYSWIDLRLKLALDPQNEVPPQNRTLRAEKDWVAPYLAVRLLNDFTTRIRHETLLGLGGFGAGDAPNLGWQVTSLLSYAISERWLITAGYRALGTRDDDLDLTFHGPILGVGLRFGGRR